MIYGYARVSSTDQNEARQIDALQKAGCDRIFLDKQSGKDFDRPQYQEMIGRLQADDVVMVHSLDRFGRNYDLIKEQWEYITKHKGADIVVLDMPILDTRQGQGLVGKLISDIVVQLLAFVSQQERENIRQRQAEGIRLAKERGVKFGRREKAVPACFSMCCTLWWAGRISGLEAAKRCQMSESSFYRKAAALREMKRSGESLFQKIKQEAEK